MPGCWEISRHAASMIASTSGTLVRREGTSRAVTCDSFQDPIATKRSIGRLLDPRVEPADADGVDERSDVDRLGDHVVGAEKLELVFALAGSVAGEDEDDLEVRRAIGLERAKDL